MRRRAIDPLPSEVVPHPRQFFVVSLFLLLIFSVIFLFGLSYFDAATATGAVLAASFLLICLVKMEAGLMLAIVAMLFSPEIKIPIGLTRPLMIRFEDLLLIVMLLGWAANMALKREYRGLVRTPLDVPIVVLIAVNIISSVKGATLANASPQMSLFCNLKLIEFYLIYFIVVNNIRIYAHIKLFLGVFLVTGAIVAMYGMIQIPSTEIFTTSRLTAPFEGEPQPNTLGGYLVLIWGLAFALWLYMSPGRLRTWCGILILVVFVPLLYTLSRGAYLSMVAVLLALGIISGKRWLLWSFVFFILASPFILPGEIIDRLTYSFRDPRYLGFLDQSAAERVLVFRKAFAYLKLRPFLGHGVAAVNILESQYARMLIETGLMGLAAFSWMVVRMFKLGFRVFKNATEGWEKGLSLGFMAGLIGLLVHGFGNITFYIIRIMEPFWFLAGLMGCLYVFTLGREQEPEPREGS